MTKPGDFVEQHERAKGTLHGTKLDGNTTDDQNHRAALYVASRAHDAEDCRELLGALGLTTPGFKWSQSSRNRRRRVTE